MTTGTPNQAASTYSETSVLPPPGPPPDPAEVTRLHKLLTAAGYTNTEASLTRHIPPLTDLVNSNTIDDIRKLVDLLRTRHAPDGAESAAHVDAATLHWAETGLPLPTVLRLAETTDWSSLETARAIWRSYGHADDDINEWWLYPPSNPGPHDLPRDTRHAAERARMWADTGFTTGTAYDWFNTPMTDDPGLVDDLLDCGFDPESADTLYDRLCPGHSYLHRQEATAALGRWLDTGLTREFINLAIDAGLTPDETAVMTADDWQAAHFLAAMRSNGK